MLIEKLKTDFEFQDERGTLTQLVRRGYSQVNVITSKGGMLRGGHYHKLNTEAFYIVSGSCKVTAYKGEQKEVFEFKAGDFFRVSPYVFHELMMEPKIHIRNRQEIHYDKIDKETFDKV